MRRIARILVPALALLLLIQTMAAAAEPRPNVVFVLSDNQSYHELGYHGNDLVQTPNLDQFAAQGVDFTQFYTEPYCSPSRASLLTGRHAMTMGVYDTVGGVSLLPAQSTTIAELLRDAGYATGIFGKWHLGDSYPLGPGDQGFETVFTHSGGGLGQLPDYYGNSLFAPHFYENGEPVETEGFVTDSLFDRALRFIERHRDEPFFCYIPTPVTHKPWAAPEAFKQPYRKKGMNKRDARLYGQIENLDQNVGRLLDRLRQWDLAKRTIVIFMADQGMGRGMPDADMAVDKNLRTVGSRGADWAQHVPFTVRYPRRVEGGRVERTLASSADLVPTLAAWCGIEHKLGDQLDGRSLVPILEDPDAAWPDRTVIIQCPRGREARKWRNASVKTQRWRLVEGKYLFDAKADPKQTNNVAEAHPEVVKRLTQAYERYWSRFKENRPPLVRPVLGAAEQPEVRLVAMDWYKGDKPWRQGALNGNQNGTWAVRVAREGRYRIELRRYPREADKPHGATQARLRVGEVVRQKKVDPDQAAIHFTVELPAGETDLRSTLTDQDGDTFGAYFVYVTWLGP